MTNDLDNLLRMGILRTRRFIRRRVLGELDDQSSRHLKDTKWLILSYVSMRLDVFVEEMKQMVLCCGNAHYGGICN